MLHEQQGMIGGTEGFPLGFCQRFEGVGYNGDGQPASLLQLYAVVDTPRRARPSITKAGNDEVGLCRKLFEIFFRRSLLRGDLAPTNHARNVVRLLDFLDKPLLK